MFDILKRWFSGISKKPGHKDRSEQWPAVRRNHLAKNSVCAACGSNKNLEVHHIKPFHVKPELELQASNLITLCESGRNGTRNCHYTFGHSYNWKGYNPDVLQDATAFLKKVKLSEKLSKS